MYGARRKKFSEFHRGACFCCLIHGVKGFMIRSVRHGMQEQPTIGALSMTHPRPQHPTKLPDWWDHLWVAEPTTGVTAMTNPEPILPENPFCMPRPEPGTWHPWPAEAEARNRSESSIAYWQTKAEEAEAKLQQARDEELEKCVKYLAERKGLASLSRQLRAALRSPDTSEAADAARMRWILQGNGYFMEESGLCGSGPCNEDEMNDARSAIDERMTQDRSYKG